MIAKNYKKINILYLLRALICPHKLNYNTRYNVSIVRRTTAQKESQVLRLLFMGESYISVYRKTGVPVSTAKKIKRRNLTVFERAYDELMTSTLKEAQRAIST